MYICGSSDSILLLEMCASRFPSAARTHRVEVGEEAERRRAVESEGQQVLEVQLRLQRPCGDGEGGQEGAALG